MVRKGIIQGLYYYTVFSVAVAFFLFVSTFSNLFDGQTSWQSPWYNENNKVNGLFLGGLFLYQLVGLFLIIIVKRKQAGMHVWKMVLLTVLYALLFGAPLILLAFDFLHRSSFNF